MAVFNKIEQFVENLCKAVHDFTSDGSCTVTVALTAAASPPVTTNSILGD